MKAKKKRIFAIPFVLIALSMMGCSEQGASSSAEELSSSEDLVSESSSSSQIEEESSSVASSEEQSQLFYSVRFHLDEEIIEERESVPDGSRITAPASSLTRGYDVHYWYSYVKGEKHPWSFSKDSISSDLDLFASFDYATYSVTFTDKKGVLATCSKEVTYKQKYDFSDVRGDNHRRVTDWKDSLGNSYGFEGVWATKGGLTLYADWEVVRYQITYHLKGGENDADNPTSYTIEECPIELKPAKKDGFRFKCWMDQNGNEMNAITEDCYGDLSLSPVWDEVHSVSLSSNIEGAGELKTGDGEAQYCYSEKVSVEAIPHEGYVFKGWYDGDKLVSTMNPYSFWMPYKDYSLTAEFWTEERENRHLLGAEPILYDGYIYYGTYPSTRVTDEETLAALNSFGEEDANDKGWYLLDGAYYAKRSRTSYKWSTSNAKFSDGALVERGVDYWFKVEAIKWRFETGGSEIFVLTSVYALDNHCFDSSSTCESFTNSELKEWLNGDFYNLAFSQDDSYIRYVFSSEPPNDSDFKVDIPSYGKGGGDLTDWARVDGDAYCWVTLYDIPYCYSLSKKTYSYIGPIDTSLTIVPVIRITSYIES